MNADENGPEGETLAEPCGPIEQAPQTQSGGRTFSDRATETELVIFRPSTIHGLGGFARTRIPKGTRILEYLGERIDKQESVRRCEANNVYIFSLNETEDLDGSADWNPARLLNHSCSPNCEAQLTDDCAHIWIRASRDINAGEELTFNYGFDLESYRDYPCSCGSPQCVGFMVAEEFFEHVRQQAEVRRLDSVRRQCSPAAWAKR